MRTLVCMKQVPGSNRAEIDPVTGVIKRNELDSKTNPYDLYALETALRLRETHGGEVTVCTMGPPQAAEVIREAYSMGADKGVLLTDRRFAGSDVLATSRALSQAVQALGGFDLIICGKQTTDGDTAQVGPEMAELLGLPSAAGITEILEADETALTVKMDMPTTIEIVRIALPCLICVEKDIFEPRLPSYVKKTATVDRDVATMTLDDLAEKDEMKYGLNGSPTQVSKIFPPPSTSEREVWHGSSDELAGRLYGALVDMKFTGERA